MARTLPSNVSHLALVHAGSYKDFCSRLKTQYPSQKIVLEKKIAVHYIVLQIEDTGETPIKKQNLYDLPLMALREEFSNFIFFKNTRSYNNVLKRMCDAEKNEETAYTLAQHMMTPFEKSIVLDLEDAKSLQIEDKAADGTLSNITYYGESIQGKEALSKLFSLDKVVVDNEEREFANLIKNYKWTVGIH